MKRILIIATVFFICPFLFSNENKIKEASYNNLFNGNSIELNEELDSSYEENNTNPFDFRIYGKSKPKSKVSKYKMHLGVGIGLLVPGVILFVSSFILIGVGVYLILYTETYNRTVQNTMYSLRGPTYTESTSYQPYQTHGIVMAGVGALFFVVGLGLMIPGIVNLALTAKYKQKKRSENIFNKVFANMLLDLNYDYYNEKYNLMVGFKL